MHYIGMDCHITNLEFVAINEAGKTIKSGSVPTSAKEFMEFVKKVPPPRKIYMEEGTLAAWALETCVQFEESLVITDPKENHWIGSSGKKDDRLDALKLAQLARGGYIKEIHHPIGQRRRFRELMMSYHDTVKSETRVKNKIKAKFRQNGLSCNGDTVYSEKHREKWKTQLPQDAFLLLIVENLWLQLEQLEKSKAAILNATRTQAKQYPEIKLFEDIPGIGFIHAATISAILETPHRFANKRKVWMYAGLGIMKRSSGGKLYSEKLTSDYNRLLKYSIKQAAQSAIMAEDNPFRQKYLRLTLEQGIAPHRAKLTVARDLLATMYAMWKNGEKYDPEIKKRVIHKKVYA